MPLTGGLRDRMIIESMFNLVKDALTDLGWFDSGRHHSPITMIDAYPGDNEEVAVNTLAVSTGDTFQSMLELGSNGEVHQMAIFYDFYGQNDSLSRHVIGDIYEILNLNPVVPIYDYRSATPYIDFYAEIVEESIEKVLPPRATNPWQKHWQMVGCVVTDDRANV